VVRKNNGWRRILKRCGSRKMTSNKLFDLKEIEITKRKWLNKKCKIGIARSLILKRNLWKKSIA